MSRGPQPDPESVLPSDGATLSVDPAVRQARKVVGLYGDPDVSWSVVMGIDLSEPVSRETIGARFGRLLPQHPHLGRRAPVRPFIHSEERAVLASLADETYGDQDALVRLALRDDGRRLLVAAHHGAVDGLGMLGILAALLETTVISSARGVPSNAEVGNFWASGLRRVAEAVFTPPRRVGSRAHRPPNPRRTGDDLVAQETDTQSAGSGQLLTAVCQSVRSWNRRLGLPSSRLVVAMGLSRRPGIPTPTPDRDTAYVRLPCDGVVDVDSARALIFATQPEPAFPETDGAGLAPKMTRLLSSRLGSTVLISNLGRVSASGLEALDFWPVPTGPYGVAVGLATVGSHARLTVRVRNEWFADDEATELAKLIAGDLAEQARAAQ